MGILDGVFVCCFFDMHHDETYGLYEGRVVYQRHNLKCPLICSLNDLVIKSDMQ